MGLTPMRVGVYAIVSQIGMIPGTLAYVNAGTELARIERPVTFVLSGRRGLSPPGRRPLRGPRGGGCPAKARVYAGFTRPDHYDNNMVVIGAGAAGLVSSYIAAAVKAKVTLVEAGKMGGDCLNYGWCRARRSSSRAAPRTTPATPTTRPDPGRAGDRLQGGDAAHSRHHPTIAPHDSVERYQGLGVEVLQGYARILDPWTVEVNLNGGGTNA